MENEKLAHVATYGTRAEADLAKGALEDAGIPAMLQADTARTFGGVRARVPSMGARKGFVLGERVPSRRD